MTNVRIVSVLSSPPTDSTFLHDKFAGLLAQGLDVHIVCWDNSEQRSRRHMLRGNDSANQRIHVAWPTSPTWLVAVLLPIALLRCLLLNPRGIWRYLLKRGPGLGPRVLRQLYLDAEIVCARPAVLHFEFGPLALQRTHLKAILGCRIIVSFRGYDLNYVALDQDGYYDEVWAGADMLHLLGQDLWARAQRRGCPPDKPHVLIAPAIDTAYFAPAPRTDTVVVGTEERPLRILSVGRLVWKKGYEYGLEAVQLLRGMGVHCEYHVVGDGDYIEAIAFARHRMNLDTEVQLLGSLPRSAVKAQMEWADVFLHPAVSEGFCNAALEAQAMQLPVVCSDADGLSENVVDGETGFVVARRQPHEMATKLAYLAGNPALRREMGAAGRRRVCSHFRLADQLSAFARLYADMLPQRSQQPDQHQISNARSSNAG